MDIEAVVIGAATAVTTAVLGALGINSRLNKHDRQLEDERLAMMATVEDAKKHIETRLDESRRERLEQIRRLETDMMPRELCAKNHMIEQNRFDDLKKVVEELRTELRRNTASMHSFQLCMRDLIATIKGQGIKIDMPSPSTEG